MSSEPKYQWICLVCGATNAPRTARCGSCLNDAALTGEEIDLLRSGKLSPELVPDHRAHQAKAEASVFKSLLNSLWLWLVFHR